MNFLLECREKAKLLMLFRGGGGLLFNLIVEKQKKRKWNEQKKERVSVSVCYDYSRENKQEGYLWVAHF